MADADVYPPTCTFEVGSGDARFSVRILPRSEKPTKIPNHLLNVLKTTYKYTIRVRITKCSSKTDNVDDDNCDVMIWKEEKPKSKRSKVIIINTISVALT